MKSGRILIAGAGGALGLPLVRRLVLEGYHVTGLTRTPVRRALLQAAGATSIVADALDPEALKQAVEAASPSQVVNLLTALPPAGALRPSDLRATNRLRTQGSANLLQAALDCGVSRIVVESFVAVLGDPILRRPLQENDPLDPIPSASPAHETIAALRSLEQQHLDARRSGRIETVVLRYGFFYGHEVPSTAAMIANLRRRRMFLPKNAGGVASWIHIEDAVTATMAVLEHQRPSAVYHIADDRPMTIEAAASVAAAAFRTAPPRFLPQWLVRLGAPLAAALCSAWLALDNGRAKHQLGWRPRYPNLGDGFAAIAQHDLSV